MGAKHFGARVARLEDPALLTGRGRFVDDIKLPGTLHACFVRSPHAHARIRSIDAAAARAMPGVHAVLTADDLPRAHGDRPDPDAGAQSLDQDAAHAARAGARTKSAMSARRIAVVIADDRYLAEDAAALVEVDFDVLPAVSDCRDAVKPDAPRAHSDLAEQHRRLRPA